MLYICAIFKSQLLFPLIQYAYSLLVWGPCMALNPQNHWRFWLQLLCLYMSPGTLFQMFLLPVYCHCCNAYARSLTCKYGSIVTFIFQWSDYIIYILYVYNNVDPFLILHIVFHNIENKLGIISPFKCCKRLIQMYIAWN